MKHCPTTGNRVFAECNFFCRGLKIGHSAKSYFAECRTRQRRLYRVYLGLCRVLQALGKAPESSSVPCSGNTISYCNGTLVLAQRLAPASCRVHEVDGSLLVFVTSWKPNKTRDLLHCYHQRSVLLTNCIGVCVTIYRWECKSRSLLVQN